MSTHRFATFDALNVSSFDVIQTMRAETASPAPTTGAMEVGAWNQAHVEAVALTPNPGY